MDYTPQRLNSHNNALCTAVSMCSMECKDAFQVKQLKLEYFVLEIRIGFKVYPWYFFSLVFGHHCFN